MTTRNAPPPSRRAPDDPERQPDPRDVDAAHPQALDTQHQQPVPMPEDPTPIEYERPLPQPGSKDYVAGQPVTDEEADKVEAEVQAKIEARDQRLEEAKQAAARAQETPPPRRSDADKRSR